MGIPMLYVFIEEAPIKKGKENWGTLSKLSGKTALYAQKAMDDAGPADEDKPADYFLWHDASEWECFEMQISFSIWNVLGPDWKRWLVNHELSHAGVDEQDERSKLITIPHDIELFYTDSEQITGLSPVAFREQFKALELAAFRAADKQDDGQTALFDGEPGAAKTKRRGRTIAVESGIDSVTFSSPGLKDVTLDKGMVADATRRLKKLQGEI